MGTVFQFTLFETALTVFRGKTGTLEKMGNQQK